jgi:hypothetical protein
VGICSRAAQLNHRIKLTEKKFMSAIRVLVGTKKGAFILTADGSRQDWKVSGPHFAGWEIYHVKGSAVASFKFESIRLTSRRLSQARNTP